MNLIGVGDLVVGQRVAPNGGVVGNNDESSKADAQDQNAVERQIQANDP